jgi:hypothetical protein
MAQPQILTVAVNAGLASSSVAYGYAMSGTAITSCSVGTAVTTTLYKTNIFTGAQYQSVSSILSASSSSGTVTT